MFIVSKKFKTFVVKQNEFVIKTLRSDNVDGYASNKFDKLCKKVEIEH